MDTKSTVQTITRSRGSGKKGKKMNLPFEVQFKNTQFITLGATWTHADLISGTAGTIATTLSPSISQTSEYSNLQTLYQNCRLLRYQIKLTPQQDASVNQQGYISLGYNLQQNLNVSTNPTSDISVENLDSFKQLFTGAVRIQIYEPKVPRNLLPLALNGDAPSPVNPYAGSPGNVIVWAPFLANSQHYFQVTQRAIWVLGPRI